MSNALVNPMETIQQGQKLMIIGIILNLLYTLPLLAGYPSITYWAVQFIPESVANLLGPVLFLQVIDRLIKFSIFTVSLYGMHTFFKGSKEKESTQNKVFIGFCIGIFVPFLCLLFLLYLHSKATKILKGAGYSVRFLGLVKPQN